MFRPYLTEMKNTIRCRYNTSALANVYFKLLEYSTNSIINDYNLYKYQNK